MAVDDASPIKGAAGGCVEPLQGGSRLLDVHEPRWLILRREAEKMVLFRGWPEEALQQAFQKRSMTIGLALDDGEFAEMETLSNRRALQDYAYLFIGKDQQGEDAFSAALRDLAGMNWSIDPDASWPVIDGSRPRASSFEVNPEERQWLFWVEA